MFYIQYLGWYPSFNCIICSRAKAALLSARVLDKHLKFLSAWFSLFFSSFSLMGFIILNCRWLIITPRKALLPIFQLRNLRKRSLLRSRKYSLSKTWFSCAVDLDDLSKSPSFLWSLVFWYTIESADFLLLYSILNWKRRLLSTLESLFREVTC